LYAIRLRKVAEALLRQKAGAYCLKSFLG